MVRKAQQCVLDGNTDHGQGARPSCVWSSGIKRSEGMHCEQVKRVWDVAKTEALELQHPSKKNARVKDLRSIAEDLCEKMNVRGIDSLRSSAARP